ncbi:MAG: carbon storage regulator CsrA [Firmicutes bacterium]|nr:carbon storage regulator CsrA [Bacillota bacterium]
MLVLARKKGQTIIIGGDIKITVADVSGETVRLGIEAPAHMEIYREEIYRAIMEENASAIAGKKELEQMLSKKL